MNHKNAQKVGNEDRIFNYFRGKIITLLFLKLAEEYEIEVMEIVLNMGEQDYIDEEDLEDSMFYIKEFKNEQERWEK